MRPYTRREFLARQTSGPMPRRSITPGRKPSIRTSARSLSRKTISRPCGLLRLTPIERLPRLVTSNRGLLGVPRPLASVRSTRTTSAPKSASSIAHMGPGPIPASSTTRMFLRGPIMHFHLQFCTRSFFERVPRKYSRQDSALYPSLVCDCKEFKSPCRNSSQHDRRRTSASC
jgi:hypothetical protein